MCNGGDGVVRVVCVQRFRDFIKCIVVVFFKTTDGSEETVGIVVELGEYFVGNVAGLFDRCGVA